MKKGLITITALILPFILFAQVYPMDGSPLNVCSGVFTDSGELGQNYSPNENLTTTICPTTPGTVIELSFIDIQLGSGDTLCIYDGNSIAAPLLDCVHPIQFNL